MAINFTFENGRGAKQPDSDPASLVRKAMGSYPTSQRRGVRAAGNNGVAQQPKEGSLDDLWSKWNDKRDPDTLHTLLSAAEPVVGKAITSYAPSASPALRSHAKLLVKRAVETFDPKKNVKFQTYLYTQLQPLRREAASYNTLYIPERIRFDLNTINKKSNEFVDEHGYEPSDAELADFSGISMKRIQHIRRYGTPQVHETALTPQTEGDMRGMPAVRQQESLWEDYVYTGLNPIDKRIYDLKTGKRGSQRELSINEIAAKLKLTPSAVSQRLKRISDEIAEGAQYGE